MDSLTDKKSYNATREMEDRSRSCRRCGGAEEFGVTVDLSRFYSDERAQVLTRACGARRSRWLVARLARALALPPRLALLAGGRLLPPRDPLRLLRTSRPQADPLSLQLIPLPEHWCGQEGLRDLQRVPSVDDIDAPALELNYSNTIQSSPHHNEPEMGKEPTPDVQTEHIEQRDSLERVSESQVKMLELQKVKQRALALLERCAGAAAGRPRRPRTRRRRRACHSPPPTQQSPTRMRQSPPPIRQSPPPTRQSPPLPRSPSVQRNRTPASTPRLVRALC